MNIALIVMLAKILYANKFFKPNMSLGAKLIWKLELLHEVMR